MHAYHDCTIVGPMWEHIHRRLSTSGMSRPTANELFSFSYAPRTDKKKPDVYVAIACALWTAYRTHTMAVIEAKIVDSPGLICMWREQVYAIADAKRRTSVKMRTAARFARNWQWVFDAVGSFSQLV